MGNPDSLTRLPLRSRPMVIPLCDANSAEAYGYLAWRSATMAARSSASRPGNSAPVDGLPAGFSAASSRSASGPAKRVAATVAPPTRRKSRRPMRFMRGTLDAARSGVQSESGRPDECRDPVDGCDHPGLPHPSPHRRARSPRASKAARATAGCWVRWRMPRANVTSANGSRRNGLHILRGPEPPTLPPPAARVSRAMHIATAKNGPALAEAWVSHCVRTLTPTLESIECFRSQLVALCSPSPARSRC